MKFSRMMMDSKTRQYALSLLLETFGKTHTNKAIYECADEWCSKQSTTSGIVLYFKAYYGKYERQEGSQTDTEEGKETS